MQDPQFSTFILPVYAKLNLWFSRWSIWTAWCRSGRPLWVGFVIWMASSAVFASDEKPQIRGLFIESPIWSDQEEGNPFLLTFEQSLFSWGDWSFGGFLGLSHLDVNAIEDSHVTGGFVPGTTTYAGHAGLTVRRTLYERPGFALNADFAGGVYYAAESFPADGSHTNFSLQAGFETVWSSRQEPTGSWVAGVRWMHVSNANILPRNSGYDGLFVRIGRRWQF